MADRPRSDKQLIGVRHTFDRAIETSRAFSAGLRLLHRIASSRPVTAANRIPLVTRRSYLYRWFSKEPEPGTNGIDLRETVTVGFVIELIGFLVDRISPHWQESKVSQLLTRTVHLVERATRLRTYQRIIDFIGRLAPAWDQVSDDQ